MALAHASSWWRSQLRFRTVRAYARITFRPHTVVWHDFHSVTGDQPVSVGYFTFDRVQYEESRRNFSHTAE